MHLPHLVCDLLRGQGHLCVHSTHHQALAQSGLLVNMYRLNRSLHLELSPHAPYVHVQTIWLDPLSQRLKETLSAELWFNLTSHPRLLSRAHFWGQGCQEDDSTSLGGTVALLLDPWPRDQGPPETRGVWCREWAPLTHELLLV